MLKNLEAIDVDILAFRLLDNLEILLAIFHRQGVQGYCLESYFFPFRIYPIVKSIDGSIALRYNDRTRCKVTNQIQRV